MIRLRPSLLVLASMIAAGTGAAQTVTWGGGFPNDNFSVASNWIGGVAPANNGSEILLFDDNSDSTVRLNVAANFLGIQVPDAGPENNEISINFTGPSSLSLGLAGVIVSSDATSSGNSVTFNVPLVLTANQTWAQVQNFNSGSIQANGAISGNYSIALVGDGTLGYCGPFVPEVFVLTSGSSTFNGGVSLSGLGSALFVGTGSSGSPDAPTSGPVGTGTLSLGDGTTLSVTNAGPTTLGNPVNAGDQSNGNPVTFGGSSNQFNPGQTVLTLTGPVSLNDDDLELDAAPNSIITLAGNLTGYTSGVCLDFGGSGSGTSIFLVQGNLSNVARLDLEDSVAVILDGSAADLGGSGTTQIATVEDIGTQSSTYLGLGKGYASAGNVSGFLTWMGGTGSAYNFQGTLGFDTTSGPTAVFDSDTINLTGFTNGSFIGLGSSTSAILGPDIQILPPGTTYLFGGGGGTLTVQTPLTDGPGEGTGLTLSAGSAPLTLILSGPATYTGTTSVSGAALIFDTPLPPGTLSLQGGYIGSTVNSGISDSNANIQAFINLFNYCSTGVIGFDAVTGTRTVTSDIDMTGLNLYLGTTTNGVTFTGTITPNNQQYLFAAVKGGQMNVASGLPDVSGQTTVVVGLPGDAGNSFYEQAVQGGGLSSVTLSGNNSYTGGTTLNSGYLFVTNDNSIGTGGLYVPNNTSVNNSWVATLAVSGAPVALANNIYIPQDGLALNTGSSELLTLNGVIADSGCYGSLGIFGPVTLTGANTYDGSTFIDGATVTSTNDNAFGSSQLTVDSSTVTFTSANPELEFGVNLSNSTLNFTSATGEPVLANLSMFQSTINFNSPTAEIDTFQGDSTGSNNVISLGTGTALTINLNSGSGGGGATYHGLISGGGSLFVTGGSNLDIQGANTYTGGTTIDADTIVIASRNSALGTGPVALNGGGLVTNTGVTVTNPITFTGPGGGVAGFGTFSPGGNLAIQNFNGIDAGSGGLNGGGGGNESSVPGPGLLTFAGGTSLTFGPHGDLLFSLANANGTPGVGYSSISVTGAGTLTITATPGNPFDIQLYSFGPNAYTVGPANNFLSTNSYSWTLLSAASISGFNANDFVFDTTNFQNPLGIGTFFVSQSGNDLMLNFTPVPEPSTWAMMASGLCALGAAVRRRRRR